MQKILIIGDGFIGKNFYKYFANKFNILILNKSELDVTDTKTSFDFSKFDLVIYAAGIKNVKLCEEQPHLSFDVNSNGINNILHAIPYSTKFVYLSTDYVFDGQSGMYSEISIPNPSSIYGYSKLLGELFCKNHSNHIVVRTSGVYGQNCKWLDNLLLDLDNNKTIDCYANIYNTPTYVVNLAEMLEDVLDLGFTGTINLCGSERANRYTLYTKTSQAFNKNDKLLLPSKCATGFPKDVSLCHTLYSVRTKKCPNNIFTGLKRLSNED